MVDPMSSTPVAEQATRAPAQSAWSYALPLPASVTRSSSCWIPATATSTDRVGLSAATTPLS
jgi:hypothetical protein